MGLHSRHLADDNFTGKDLKGAPSHVGMMQPSGNSPYYIALAVVVAIALAVLFVR